MRFFTFSFPLPLCVACYSSSSLIYPIVFLAMTPGQNYYVVPVLGRWNLRFYDTRRWLIGLPKCSRIKGYIVGLSLFLILFFFFLSSNILLSIDDCGLISESDVSHLRGLLGWLNFYLFRLFETDPLQMIGIYELGMVFWVDCLWTLVWNCGDYDRVLCV